MPHKNNSKNMQVGDSIRVKENDSVVKPVVVGANRTAAYLTLLKDKKVGIVANQTSIIFNNDFYRQIDSSQNQPGNPDKNYVHIVDSLLSHGIDIQKVFAPEHGFRGNADAGEEVADGKDKKTGLPVISLYGKNKKPANEQLSGLDVVVFDIQDVGVRFYTYISTLHYVMEACAENNIPVLVFDRPNPNGNYIDGPTMEKEHRSFLGMHTIPLVHGMTIGEYARMINGEKWLKDSLQCVLNVIIMDNYHHNLSYSLPVRPSPNLPNDQAINLYPGLGLFEGTNINAGRGTEFQFQRYGAPFLNKEVFKFTYTPVSNFGAKSPKHKDKLCYGEDLRNVTPPQKVSLEWIIKAYKNCADKSLFFNTDSFTKHAGTEKLQRQIEQGLTEEEIRATWQQDIENFKATREKYLLYN
ncbi:DUF1343 domain-containing protein [Abyssalbus ytuae]|uniref:DUF1343 domain-containing protein n=1 Tax=Abyssalbus ytuae TaxID=2926907 RepID=A0A9E6ZLN7_9FLAO|nr:DUF1343 domain-containing protein [Abyssalbus ytuae]UOB16455.1 DUF1343 domain-containing protein [Abyssalbus ytuae]